MMTCSNEITLIITSIFVVIFVSDHGDPYMYCITRSHDGRTSSGGRGGGGGGDDMYPHALS